MPFHRWFSNRSVGRAGTFALALAWAGLVAPAPVQALSMPAKTFKLPAGMASAAPVSAPSPAAEPPRNQQNAEPPRSQQSAEPPRIQQSAEPPRGPSSPPTPPAQPSAGTAPAPAAAPSPAAGAGALAIQLTGLRQSVDEETLRLTIELSAPVTFTERASGALWQLSLPGVAAPINEFPLGDAVLPTLTARTDASGTTLEVPWKYSCLTSVEVGPTPERLTITFRKRYSDTRREVLAPGVVHEARRTATPESGPLSVHVLRVDPRVPGVRVEPALADPKSLFARDTVSAMTRRYRALAGINGAYFSMKTGEPLGLVMLDGQVISAPLYNRTAFALGPNGEVFIGNTQLSSQMRLPNGESYDFDAVNAARGLNRIALYTSRYGASTFSAAAGGASKEFSLLPDGTVYAIQEANSSIPLGGYVISAHGQAAAWLERALRVGDKVQLRTPLTDYWPGAKHALGGGPTLLRLGQVQVTAVEEQFKPDIAVGASSRTALGVTPEGEILLVTVDGRQPTLSRGLSLAGLAYLMQQLGATDALNLDGGGSTAMAIGPALVNRPSDGMERRVNNAVLVYADQANRVSARP